jgi:hypothetical protein
VEELRQPLLAGIPNQEELVGPQGRDHFEWTIGKGIRGHGDAPSHDGFVEPDSVMGLAGRNGF